MRQSGVSKIVTVVVLSIIAVFLMVLVASMGAENVGRVAAGNPSISVSVETLKVSQNDYALSIDIANIGNIDVTITGVEVRGTNCKVNFSKELSPAQTYHLSLTCSLTPGRYVLEVKGGDLSWEFPLNVI